MSVTKVIRKLSPIALIFISFLLTGCPMNSKFSLVDKPTLKIDQRLLGKWKIVIPQGDDDNNYVSEVEISKSSATEYQFVVTKWNNDPNDSNRYTPDTQTLRAYLADFSGHDWLIVNEVDINWFFRIESITNDEIFIYELGSGAGYYNGDTSTEEAFRKYVSEQPRFEQQLHWVKQ